MHSLLSGSSTKNMFDLLVGKSIGVQTLGRDANKCKIDMPSPPDVTLPFDQPNPPPFTCIFFFFFFFKKKKIHNGSMPRNSMGQKTFRLNMIEISSFIQSKIVL